MQDKAAQGNPTAHQDEHKNEQNNDKQDEQHEHKHFVNFYKHNNRTAQNKKSTTDAILICLVWIASNIRKC